MAAAPFPLEPGISRFSAVSPVRNSLLEELEQDNSVPCLLEFMEMSVWVNVSCKMPLVGFLGPGVGLDPCGSLPTREILVLGHYWP